MPPLGTRIHNACPRVIIECSMTTDWTLAYDAYEPAQEGLREALTSTGLPVSSAPVARSSACNRW